MYGAAAVMSFILYKSLHRAEFSSSLDNLMFRNAILEDHLDVIKLLLTDHRIDPNMRMAPDFGNLDSAIEYACKHNRLEVVKLLISDKRVDPTANNNYAIRLATSCKHLEVVKLLENAGCNLPS